MTLFNVIFVSGCFVILLFAVRKNRIGFGFLSALCGFFALIASYLAGRFIEVNIPITPFSVAVSAVGGIPGVILLTVLLTIFS